MFIPVASTYILKAIFKLFVLFSFLSFIVKKNLFLQITEYSENSLPFPQLLFETWHVKKCSN